MSNREIPRSCRDEGATHSHACECREAKFKRMTEALKGLMLAHKKVFIGHISAAFVGGDTGFLSAWVAAQEALKDWDE